MFVSEILKKASHKCVIQSFNRKIAMGDNELFVLRTRYIFTKKWLVYFFLRPLYTTHHLITNLLRYPFFSVLFALAGLGNSPMLCFYTRGCYRAFVSCIFTSCDY